MIRSSGDGRFLFVQNAAPATSVSVVDRNFVAEVSMPRLRNRRSTMSRAPAPRSSRALRA